MGPMKELPSWVVIGDLVGSRRAGDRRATHERLAAAMVEIDSWLTPRGERVVPFRSGCG